MTLDEFLNIIVPAGIFIAIAVFIYSKGKVHIDKFFKMVKGWFEPKDDGSDDAGGGGDEGESLNYRINYRGAEY